MWRYQAKLVKAVDGDTVDLIADLGFNIYAKIRVRVLGVDTPERGQPGFHEATRFVEDWFATSSGECVVETVKTGKYGRWLGTIYLPDAEPGEVTLNQALLDAGMGAPYQ